MSALGFQKEPANPHTRPLSAFQRIATSIQGPINLKTALEMGSGWPTASNQKRLQTLMFSPCLSDALDYTYTGDNQIGLGTTNLSDNLQ
jgi:hypothetical protein